MIHRPLVSSHVAFCVVLVGTMLTCSSDLQAQWTLPQGEVVLNASFIFSQAGTEFFGQEGETQKERSFPLNGEYFGASFELGARLGLTPKLEAQLKVPFSAVSYSADSVLLLPEPQGSGEGIDYYQRNVLDLDQARFGLGDVRLAVVYNFLRAPLVLSVDLGVKLPTGYDPPAGTFGRRPRSQQDFLENVGQYVAPDNIQDDVTLGDGQVDVQSRVLLGKSFPTRTFIAGELGYNLRLGGAGDQFVAGVRVGQLIEGRFMLFAYLDSAITVQSGDVIGISVAAQDPELPAQDYLGLENLMLREVRLQKDFVNVGAGVVYRLGDNAEVKLSYGRTVWGVNVAAVNTLIVGVGGKLTLFNPAPD